MKKLIIILLYFIGLFSFGQSFEFRETAQSPNASTLGQYGEIPVSQFTGIPRIEIPIHEFEIDGHKFPIIINYHTSGIRVEQKPSWVGAGWNLLAGGSIIRLQNGGADEEKFQDGSGHEPGYFYHYSDLNQTNWGTQAFINNFMASKTGSQLVFENDYDADEFQFNFLGYNGSFFKDHTGSWQVRCDKCIRIEDMYLDNVSFTLPTRMANKHTKVIKGFILTADDGTRYQFGYNDNAIDFSIPFSNQKESFWTSMAWHLTKVTYPSGTSITLQYTRGDFTSQIWRDYSERGGQYSNSNYSFNNYNIYDVFGLYSGMLISPSYLTTIIIPQGRIIFYSSNKQQLEHSINVSSNPNTDYYYYLIKGLHGEHTASHPAPIQSRALDSIVVSNKENSRINKIRFNYFSNPNRKLGLKSIEFHGSGNDAEKYTFGYYNRDLLPESYDIRWTDHWGYYRGSKWNPRGTLIEERNPVETFAGYGVLNKITYPTGGYTRFEYEPHKCFYVLNATKTGYEYNSRLVGGCRIKRIINSPTGRSSDEIVAKEYFYVKDYQNYAVDPIMSTSGMLAGLPRYDVTGYILSCPKKSGLSCSLNLYAMNHSVYSGGMNSMGSHIGYSEVAEKYPNGSFRIYKFSNYEHYLDNMATALYDGTRREFVKYSSMDQMRGLLLRLDEYNANKTLVKSEVYTYKMDTTKFVRGLYINIMDKVQSGNEFYPILEACTYKHYTDVPRLVETEDIEYSNGVSNHRFHKYEYNQYGQISRVVENDNQGDSIETNYQYIWQMPGYNVSDFVKSPIYSIERNIHHPLGYWNDWNYKVNSYIRLGANHYVPTRLYDMNFGNGGNHVDTTICDYDILGHLIYQAKNNGLDRVVYLWHYSGQYIVGIIKNATLDDVMDALYCVKDDLGSMPDDNDNIMETLREQLPYALVTSYHYKPLVGMVSETSPAGITRYYEYDNHGRLNGVKNDRGEYLEFYKYNIAEQ